MPSYLILQFIRNYKQTSTAEQLLLNLIIADIFSSHYSLLSVAHSFAALVVDAVLLKNLKHHSKNSRLTARICLSCKLIKLTSEVVAMSLNNVCGTSVV